jgi:chemotaxis protein MotB
MLLILTTGTGKTKNDFIRGIEKYLEGKSYATGRTGTGASELDDFKQIIAEVIQKSDLSGQVNLQRNRTGIELSFQGALVFGSATAVLEEEAKGILTAVAGLIKELPKKYYVIVEGHSDSRPITSNVYPSNWELSAARAGGVVRFLAAQGFPSNRMRAIGFADTQPLEDEADSEKNRRVVVKIDSDKVLGY